MIRFPKFTLAAIGFCFILISALAEAQTKLTLTLGQVDVATAETNLKWFESQTGDVTLPEGLICFSRAPRITQSNIKIKGAGAGRTKIKNAYNYAPFGDNCSLQILNGFSPGYGYADGIQLVPSQNQKDPTAITQVTLYDASVVTNYPVGALVFTWKWDGYADGVTNTTRVRSHKITARNGTRITLDSYPDPSATAINWVTSGCRTAPITEGQNSVTIRTGDTIPTNFKVGTRVRVTGGPTSANEVIGENRIIKSINANKIELNRPLRYSYGASASIIQLTSVDNVTISDLTILAPPHPQGSATYFAGATNLTFERVNIEGDFQITLCSDVKLTQCNATESIFFNGTHDVDVNECKMRHAYVEERVFDAIFRNSRISGPAYGGFTSNIAAPSERIQLRNMVIEATRDMPICLNGKECLLENIRIQGSQNPVSYIFAYVGGDKLVIKGYVSDLPTIVQNGESVCLQGVQSLIMLGWTGPNYPTGTATQCNKVDDSRLPALTKQQWAYAATTITNLVSALPPNEDPFKNVPKKTKIARPKPTSVR